MNQEERDYLDKYDISAYSRPSIATDITLFTLTSETSDARCTAFKGLQVLLIKRASYPFKDKWALPGGFCRPDETADETAERELFEETNVSNAYLEKSNLYSDLSRDPRGWIMSQSFMGIINKHDCKLRADTDAWDAKWFDISLDETLISENKSGNTITKIYGYALTLKSKDETLLSTIKCEKTFDGVRTKYKWSIDSTNLGFDHSVIIVQTFLKLRQDIVKDIRLVFEFMSEQFTLGELEGAYKAIYGVKTRIPNFRRTIEKYVSPTNTYINDVKGAPQLFIRNETMF